MRDLFRVRLGPTGIYEKKLKRTAGILRALLQMPKKGQSRLLGSALSDRPSVFMALKGFVFSYKGKNIRFDPFAPVPFFLLILFLHGLPFLSCLVWFRRLKISVTPSPPLRVAQE
jgi:hypothetical protein